jgi:hypothetical protein
MVSILSPINFLILINSDLFHPDNVKNLQEGAKISQSLYKYYYEMGGASKLAQSLNSNIKVSAF